MPTKPHTFRLNVQDSGLLERLAAASGDTTGAYLRRVVEDHIYGQNTDQISLRLLAIEDELRRIRRSFALSTESIMVFGSSPEKPTEEEIKSWVQNNLG